VSKLFPEEREVSKKAFLCSKLESCETASLFECVVALN
jgi:hypothetical protein